ncbi:outer membrane protein [Cupriavidus malaysiensis]|uniref:Flagellar motor protein MotB n=1 Tax=Cupriavidus malaysiensis TaxID=367825 RepID=A0ABN4TH86_9BURK|nr:outer membrane beta-barrel protein [Cupriavidus malaysiensis]AOZ06532.1 flagellar motor protein MotB [Cupriavidus malaysiensis]
MNIGKIALTFAALAFCGHAAAQSDNPGNIEAFTGPYIGTKVGANISSVSGATNRSSHTTIFPGFVAGYGFGVGPAVIGAEIFADLHFGSATNKDIGIDAKLGYPIGSFMPYGRVGVTGTSPSYRIHYGAGVEYMATRNISVFSEWTGDTDRAGGSRWVNSSFTIGVNYRLR